ncbi:MAG: hypothetical protein AAGC55_34015 [Myxococcota bacterium]
MGLALVLGVWLGSCRASQPALRPGTLDDLIAWSGAKSHRGTAADGSDLYLLTVRRGAPLPARPGPAADRPCVRARSFLPGPAHEDTPRIFYIIDGALHGQAVSGTAPGAVRPLSGLDRSLTLTRLLAVGRDPAKVELLALVRSGAAGTGGTGRPWLLTLVGDRISAAEPTGDIPAFRSQQAFFARFHVPRCKRADQRCVAVVPAASSVANSASSAAVVVVEEPRRGQPTRVLADLAQRVGELAGIMDVAWVAGDDDALYLALRCRAAAP